MVSILQGTFQFWLVATTVFVFVRLPSQSAAAHCRRSRFWHSCRCLCSFSRPFCFYSRSNNLSTLACFIPSSAPLTSNPPAIFAYFFHFSLCGCRPFCHRRRCPLYSPAILIGNVYRQRFQFVIHLTLYRTFAYLPWIHTQDSSPCVLDHRDRELIHYSDVHQPIELGNVNWKTMFFC